MSAVEGAVSADVSVTEARLRLAELVNRVAFGGETIFLCRHGRQVAMLAPVAHRECSADGAEQ